MTKIVTVRQVKEKHASMGHHVPIPKGRGRSVPNFFGTLYLRPNGLT